MAKESDSQVKVGRRHPAKLRSCCSPTGEIRLEDLSMGVRDGQPEKCADASLRDCYRAFDQCVGAQAPGKPGRQPNCELTESMPAARFACWMV